MRRPCPWSRAWRCEHPSSKRPDGGPPGRVADASPLCSTRERAELRIANGSCPYYPFLPWRNTSCEENFQIHARLENSCPGALSAAATAGRAGALLSIAGPPCPGCHGPGRPHRPQDVHRQEPRRHRHRLAPLVAVGQANAHPGADTIDFAHGLKGTITLSGELSVTDYLTIDGPGAKKRSPSAAAAPPASSTSATAVRTSPR